MNGLAIPELQLTGTPSASEAAVGVLTYTQQMGRAYCGWAWL